MRLSDFAIKRPVTMVMIVAVILIFGFVSLSKMSIDLLPDIEVPVILVLTTYPGASSDQIEDTVTKPLEKALSSVENVKSITSDSQPNVSSVKISFKWGTDLDVANMNVREKMDLIKKTLPENAEEPVILKMDPSMMPILILGMKGERDVLLMKQIADDQIVKQIENVEGVSSVIVSGGAERQIRVRVMPEKLAGYNVALTQVVQALKAANINVPAGDVDYGGRELIVKTTGEFTDIEDIKNLVVVNRQGSVIRVCDLATVEDATEDVNVYSRVNGKEGLLILVQKQSDENTVRVVQKVKKELKNIEKQLPQNIEIYEIMDQSDFINKAIDSVKSNAIQGAILAVLVIFAFLHSIKSTMVIAFSIPLSIIATFVLMYFGNLTLNVMSLGGLAIGVGMLVDNSIVVLENIYRHQELGKSQLEAARVGASEVTLAIMASTLTTIAVFLPIVFIEGMVSTIFKELSLTITFSLISSILVAVTLVPLLSSKLIDIKKQKEVKNNFFSKIFNKVDGFYNRVDEGYGRLLTWALDHRKRFILIIAIMVIVSIAAIPLIGSEFFPETDEGKIAIDVKLPIGTKVEKTDEIMRHIENIILDIPEVDQFSTQVGTTTVKSFTGSGSGEIGSLDVSLVSKQDRKRSTKDVVEEIRQKIGEIPGAEINVTSSTVTSKVGAATGGSKPIQLAIKGDDFEVLEDLSKEVENIVKNVPGARDIESTIEEGRPEVQIKIDKNKASYYNLDVSAVALTLRAAVNGTVATQYKVAGSEIDVNVQLADKAIDTIEDLKSITMMSPKGINVPISYIADFDMTEGPNVIKRDNQERIVYVSADLYQRSIGKVVKDIKAETAKMQLPEGYTIDFEGQNKEMEEAFGELGLAMVLAVILVYAVMASQFESFLHPFTIMFSLPVAIIGVVFGLLLNRRPFCVPAYMGLIMLAGIAVNNAIVLVDYINQLKAEGKSTREAIIEAGPTRLRAISMTTLTTVLGLLPLSLGLGEGAEIQAPLAVVVMYGLLASTILTLVFVPVLYSLFEDWAGKIQARKGKTSDSTLEI